MKFSTAAIKLNISGVQVSRWAWSWPSSAACVIFPLLFIAATGYLETIQPGYSRSADTISELVWGNLGWLLNVAFITIAFNLWLVAARLKIAALPLGLIGLGFIVIAIFPTAAPGGSVTAPAIIHEVTVEIIAALFPVACFSLAKSWLNTPQHHNVAICCLVAGLTGIVLNLAGFIALHGDSAWIGAVERLIVLNGLAWLQLLSLHLIMLQTPWPLATVSRLAGKIGACLNNIGRPEPQPIEVRVSARNHSPYCCSTTTKK
jgi:hypothetical protein